MSSVAEIQLPTQLTVRYVQNLHEQLEKLVYDVDTETIRLDAANVSRADTAGVQLLFSLVQAASERQITLNWHEPSEHLKSAVDTLGMNQHIKFS